MKWRACIWQVEYGTGRERLCGAPAGPVGWCNEHAAAAVAEHGWSGEWALCPEPVESAVPYRFIDRCGRPSMHGYLCREHWPEAVRCDTGEK